jgi:hypothetical protein
MKRDRDFEIVIEELEYFIGKVDELQNLIHSIRDTLDSGEKNDYIVSRINTITFGWRNYKDEVRNGITGD